MDVMDVLRKKWTSTDVIVKEWDSFDFFWFVMAKKGAAGAAVWPLTRQDFIIQSIHNYVVEAFCGYRFIVVGFLSPHTPNINYAMCIILHIQIASLLKNKTYLLDRKYAKIDF